MTETAALSRREWRARNLMDRIAAFNDAGHAPSKLHLIGDVPSRTRARHYRIIDTLIQRGLVANDGTTGKYALVVTSAGRAALRAQDV